MIKRLAAAYAKLSRRERAVFYATAAVLALLFGDRLVLGPVVDRTLALEREIQEREASIRKSMHVVRRKAEILADGKKLVDYAADASENPEKLMTGLLKELETIANRSTVSLIYVRPGTTVTEQGMTRLLANLECEAEMPEVAMFFHHIESSNKLLRIEKYEIQPKSKETSVARCVMTVSKTVIPISTR